MQLKMIVETCSYEVDDDAGRLVPEVTEILDVQEFIIPVMYVDEKGHYVPCDTKQMLRPYVHLIEAAVLDNVDYVEIATVCDFEDEFFEAVDAYEPSHEKYLIDILAKMLYEHGISKIVPTQGNIMYRLIYVLEEAGEI